MKNISKIAKFLLVAAIVFAAAYTLTGNDVLAGVTAGAYASLTDLITIPTTAFGAYVGAAGMKVGKGSPVLVNSNERDRAVYEHNKAKYGNDISPSTLRLEARITNGKADLRFSIIEGDDTVVRPTEIRLLRNDKFIVSDISFQLLKQAIGKTNGALYTYPNVSVFGQAAADDLMALYAGKLDVTIGKTKKLYNYDLMRFLQIPETQKTGVANFDQKTKSLGFDHLTPQLILDGSGSNELVVTFPSFAAWAGASADAAYEHVAVLIFRGFLVNNGSANK